MDNWWIWQCTNIIIIIIIIIVVVVVVVNTIIRYILENPLRFRTTIARVPINNEPDKLLNRMEKKEFRPVV